MSPSARLPPSRAVPAGWKLGSGPEATEPTVLCCRNCCTAESIFGFARVHYRGLTKNGNRPFVGMRPGNTS